MLLLLSLKYIRGRSNILRTKTKEGGKKREREREIVPFYSLYGFITDVSNVNWETGDVY